MSNENIKTNLDESNSSAKNTMDVVFASTNKILDALEVGNKITLRDLIDHVVAETGVQVSVANGLVPMCAHENPEVTIEKGRNGGVFKGGRPKRIDPRPRCESCNQVVRFPKES